jgi:hypothetical protein
MAANQEVNQQTNQANKQQPTYPNTNQTNTKPTQYTAITKILYMNPAFLSWLKCLSNGSKISLEAFFKSQSRRINNEKPARNSPTDFRL